MPPWVRSWMTIKTVGVLDQADGRLGDDLDLIIADVEVAELIAGEQRLEGGRDGADRDADVARPVDGRS